MSVNAVLFTFHGTDLRCIQHAKKKLVIAEKSLIYLPEQAGPNKARSTY